MTASGLLLLAAFPVDVSDGVVHPWNVPTPMMAGAVLLGAAALASRRLASGPVLVAAMLLGLAGALVDVWQTMTWADRTALYEASVLFETLGFLQAAGSVALAASRGLVPRLADAGLRFGLLCVAAGQGLAVLGDAGGGARGATPLRALFAVVLAAALLRGDREPQDAATRP
jgi:hypothetical protein